jgi:hypothetical protein
MEMRSMDGTYIGCGPGRMSALVAAMKGGIGCGAGAFVGGSPSIWATLNTV